MMDPPKTNSWEGDNMMLVPFYKCASLVHAHVCQHTSLCFVNIKHFQQMNAIASSIFRYVALCFAQVSLLHPPDTHGLVNANHVK